MARPTGLARDCGRLAELRERPAKDLLSFRRDGGALTIGAARTMKSEHSNCGRLTWMARLELADAGWPSTAVNSRLGDSGLVGLEGALPRRQGSAKSVARHVVDGVYFARADGATRMLTDTEVA